MSAVNSEIELPHSEILYPQHLFQLHIPRFTYRYFSAGFKDSDMRVFFVRVNTRNILNFDDIGAVHTNELRWVERLLKKTHSFIFQERTFGRMHAYIIVVRL